jgi:hypothetical protein
MPYRIDQLTGMDANGGQVLASIGGRTVKIGLSKDLRVAMLMREWGYEERAARDFIDCKSNNEQILSGIMDRGTSFHCRVSNMMPASFLVKIIW